MIKLKNSWPVVTIFSLVSAVTLTLLLGGCADAPYANNAIRSPEARYDTYYAPHYYPIPGMPITAARTTTPSKLQVDPFLLGSGR